MIDRYTKTVLTVIAGALLYLGAIFTPLPGVSAQSGRAGELSGPTQVVVVGWRTPAGEMVPVAFQRPLPVTLAETVKVTGTVTTERSTDRADRVILVGWEENASRNKAGRMEELNDNESPSREALPVRLPK